MDDDAASGKSPSNLGLTSMASEVWFNGGEFEGDLWAKGIDPATGHNMNERRSWNVRNLRTASMSCVDTLANRWNELCSTLGLAQSVASLWWQRITTAYEERHRRYHSLGLLHNLFDTLDACEATAAVNDVPAVQLAIFFHAIVRRPEARAGENESASAAALFQFTSQLQPAHAHLGDKVCRWIACERDAPPDPGEDADGHLLLDVRRAVLGRPWEAFATATQQLRGESEEAEIDYCLRRGAQVDALLGAPRIFATKAFAALEPQARENLAREAAEAHAQFAQFPALERAAARLRAWRESLPSLGCLACRNLEYYSDEPALVSDSAQVLTEEPGAVAPNRGRRATMTGVWPQA